MYKRILSLILVLATVMGMFAVPANAASTLDEAMADVNVYAEKTDLNWLTMNGSVKVQWYTYYNYVSPNGTTKEVPAYCVDPELYGVPTMVPEGTPIRYGADHLETDPKLVGILSNGYPHLTLADLGVTSKQQAYYATKMALWCYLIGSWNIGSLGINPNLTGADRQVAENVLAAAKAIYQRGMAWDQMYSPKLTATPDQSSAYAVTINGQECYQQVFTIDSDTWALEPVRVSLGQGAPAGTKIMSMENTEITTFKLSTTRTPGAGYQAQIKIVYPKSAVEGQSGSAQLKFDTVVVEYKIFYAKTLQRSEYGDIQDYLLDTDPDTPISVSAISSYSSEPTPPPPDEPDPEPEESTLKIIKLETGTEIPLAGAIFDVWYPDGSKYGSFSSGSDGTITLPINVFGNYTVTERVPPQYHILPEISTQHVTVTALTGGVLTFWNSPFGSLRVHKISNTGDNLEGVSITIKCLETGETQTGRTNSAGVVEFTNLKPGGYEVKETAGIAGYVVDVEATKTSTVVTGQTSEVTFINREKPGLKIIKYDRVTLQTMSDISFEIWRDGESLGIYKTGATGEILMTDLEPGTYIVKEVQTDNGHIADPTPQQIELKPGDGVRQLLFYNDQKPGLYLIKVDSSNLSKVIPNVKFSIRSVAGDYGPKEFTTDANGEIDLSMLPTGAYEVTEIECPDHYLIDNPTRIIQLNANETAQFVFTDTAKPSLEVVKYDPATGKYLAGATFRISKIEDGSHYLDRVTDTNGRIRIDDLEPGVYSVQEMSAPAGYILNPTEYHVELFPGRTSELIVNNEKKPDLRIIKTDAITGRPIAGATFTVRKVDSSTLITETTDANGEILLREMDPGVYEVTEQSVPDEYLLDPIPQKITLFPNRLGIVQFQNYPRPGLTIRKIDSATGGPVEGALFRITYASNHTFTGELNLIGEYYTDADGFIKVDKLRDGWYRVEELEAPAGYRIKDNGIQECYIAAGRDKVLTFENIPLSTILIQKMDEETGEPLPGAWFRMRYLNNMTGMDGTTIGEWPTDDKGQIEVTGLDEGTYVIDEISAPAGYVLNAANTRTVYLSGESQDFVTVTYGNQKMGALLVMKKDALTGAPLAGVEFYICDSNGAVIGNSNGKFVTDFAGSILINNLKPGSTIVARESRTISGYVLDDTPQTVKIRANETVSLEFRNKPKGTLIIDKVDSVTGDPLTGAQFKIVSSNGELTADNEGLTSSNGIYTVDRNGQVVLEKLTPGTYVVTETKAPEGYILDGQPQTVVVNAGDTQVLTFANAPKGAIVVQKYVAGTTEPLAGVQFLITDGTGAAVGNTNGLFLTDYNGRIVLPDLTPGTTITARETETVSGFVLDSTPQSAVVKAGEAQELIFFNEPKGGLIIRKLDSVTGMPLGGAEFKITTIDGTYVDDREGQLSTKGLYQTDYYGEIWLENLEPDTYVVRETRAPDGYVLGGEEQTVKVNADDVQTLTFYNVPKQTVVIQKYIEGTTKPLAGATFLVTDGAGTPVGSATGEHITDHNGRIVLTGLIPGTTLVVREIRTVKGYELDGTPQVIVVGINAGEKADPYMPIIEECKSESSARLLDDSMITIGTGNSLVFYDDPLSTLIIHKYIEGTANEPLAGVAFKVTDGNGGAVGRNDGVWYTNAEGEIIITDLEQGTDITVREVKTVDGFVLDGTPKQVRINSSEVHELTFWNKRQGALTIRKLDSVTQQPLEGVTFKITTATGEFVPDKNGKISSNGLYKTDRAGEIVITGVTGTLVVTEIETIPGYTIHEESRSQTVVVNPDDTQVLTFYNDPTQTLTINKFVTGTTTPIEGVTFLVISSDGQVVGSSNGEFQTDRNGQIVISGLVPGTTITAKEVRTVSGYVLDTTPQSILIRQGAAQTLNFYNQRKGSLVIEKRDSVTGDPLSGAEFLILTIDGQYVDDNEGATSTQGKYRTDDNGQIILTKLQPGTYVVRETKAPEGYILDSEEKSVKVNENDTQTLKFTNTPLQSVTIQKFIAGTTTGLAGVTFLVTDANGAPVGSPAGEHITDENGRIVITGLKPGMTIIAKEVRTVKGYVLNGTPQTIVVGRGATSSGASDTGNTLTFYDDPLSILVVQKFVEGTTTPIVGVRFLITRSDGRAVGNTNGEYTTDSNGRIEIKDLEPGITITAKEIHAADGYVLDSTPKTIEIKSGDVQELTFYNAPTGSLIIVKKDSATGELLKGAEFQITYANGEPVGNLGGTVTSNGIYTTDERGQITITGLQPCVLTVRETRAPANHVLDNQPRTVTVSAGDTQTLTVPNDPCGTLKIVKRDRATGALLKGAEFEITYADGSFVGNYGGTVTSNGMYTTDVNGEIVIKGLKPSTIVIRETRAPEGYILDSTPVTVEVAANDTQTIDIFNSTTQTLTVQKYITGTTKPIAGVKFLITDSSGAVVGPNNGVYTTDATGRIVLNGLTPGTTITANELEAADGYVLDTTPQSILIKAGEAQTLVFYNSADGGVELVKVDADNKAKRLGNATIEIRRMNQGVVTTVTTGEDGRAVVKLDAGDYYAVEIEAPEGYKLDDTPHYFTVADGKTTTVTIKNKAYSGIEIHKIDAITGEGIYGVSFLLYDSKNNVVGQYTSDDHGYVRIMELDAGTYRLRELENPGYIVDTQLKTVEVKSGEVTLVELKNTPITGQIQILKTSADYNSVNGWPEGTPIPNTIFEVYNRAGKLVDTIKTDKNGVAATKPLPLGRYKVVESKAADFYALDKTPIEVEIEFAGQIVRAAMTNKSLYTNVSITKRGYVEVMPGQVIRYDFSNIANNSNTALESFYWRDTLPTNAVRLEQIVTGTWNARGNYKIVYKTNYSSEYRVLADSLATNRNYVLNASPAALGLGNGEYVTEFMAVFGVVPANFRQVEAPQVYCKVLDNLAGGTEFCNTADVGGLYNGQWIMAVDRWVTRVYKPSSPLPRTGY